ncbi:MAG: helix-turn-helix domain-containing protein [Nanoarchaeota archaeon]
MEQELIKLGLGKKEADVYMVCLKVGEATANRIAELSDLPRSTTYDILERLKYLGLISIYVRDSKTYFISNSPESLKSMLDEKRDVLNKILPDLKRVQNQILDKPSAEVFQGKNSILKIFDEILDNAKSLKVIGSMGNAFEKIGYHPEKFRMKRIEKRIRIKQILECSEQSRKVSNDKYTEVKFLNSLENSKEGIFIFKGYVYHIIFQYEISAIKIKSEDHSKAMEIMFDELWKKSNKK